MTLLKTKSHSHTAISAVGQTHNTAVRDALDSSEYDSKRFFLEGQSNMTDYKSLQSVETMYDEVIM